MSVNQTAHELVHSARAKEYGDFGDICKRTIALYAAWKDHQWGMAAILDTPKDVSMFMTFFKLAREGNKHKTDNIVDACGYLELYEQAIEKEQISTEVETECESFGD